MFLTDQRVAAIFCNGTQPLKSYSAMSEQFFSPICLLLWVFMSVIKHYLVGAKKDFVELELSALVVFNASLTTKFQYRLFVCKLQYTGAVIEY